MLIAFSTLLLATALFYALWLGRIALGFRRVQQGAPSASAEKPFVSVIVAARDEAETIEHCLRSILANDYPPECFEVLLVDDFSTDATPALVRRLQQKRQRVPAGSDAPDAPAPPLRLLSMEEVAEASAGHKQAALAHGIRRARGEIILTTDADCTVGPAWIRTMIGCFGKDTAFVSGPVRYRPGESLFGRLQALEFTALVTFGAGAIGAGRPNICNSANVAYRRMAYERFGPARHDKPPGPADDELLLQRLAAEPDWTVRFCAAPAAVVDTDPAPTLRAFLVQRRRWASMSARYPNPALVAAIAGLYLFYVLLLVGLVAVWFVPALWPVLGAVLGLKMLSEAAMVYPACRRFGQRRLFRYFPLAQLFQIPYVVYIGLAGALGSVHWKGRRIF